MKKIKFLKLLVFFVAFMQNANAGISCEVRHTLHHDDFEIHATYRFIIADDTGIIMINGSTKSGAERYVISREVHFNYLRKNGNDYLFTSKRVHKNPIDTFPDPLALKHFPKFFIEKDNNLTFHINSINRTDYIISFVSTPLFYCNGK